MLLSYLLLVLAMAVLRSERGGSSDPEILVAGDAHVGAGAIAAQGCGRLRGATAPRTAGSVIDWGPVPGFGGSDHASRKMEAGGPPLGS